MKDKTIMRIPYALANYERVVQTNCSCVDKTMYLKTVEEEWRSGYRSCQNSTKGFQPQP